MKPPAALYSALWLFCVIAPSADAGHRITYEAVSYSEENDSPQVMNRQKNSLLIDRGRFRTVGGDVEGFDLIADVDSSTICVLDATQNAYAVIPFPLRDETDTAESPSMFRIDVHDTGPTILGYATRQYRIYEDGNLVREIYTTDRLPMGFDFMHAMEGLERAFQDFAPSDDYSDLRALFRQVRGVPLKDIRFYPYGRDVLQALRIERQHFRAEEFLPPRDYVLKTLQALSEGGVVGDDTETQPSGSP